MGPTPTALLLTPVFDAPTAFTYVLGSTIQDYLEERGWKVARLENVLASRFFLDTHRLYVKPDFIWYGGHGIDGAWLGQIPPAPLLNMMDVVNMGDVANTVVYNVACVTGRLLAPKAPSTAFIASTDSVYTAVADPSHNYALDFADVLMEPVRQIAGGGSAMDALVGLKEKATDYLESYQTNQGRWAFAEVYARYLQTNRDFYSVWGNPDARVR